MIAKPDKIQEMQIKQYPQEDDRKPGLSTSWHLWYLDTFDQESTPSLEASGAEFLQGLYELWQHTLMEGILDSGSASFSYFFLSWGDFPVQRVDVRVDPFNNTSLLKLRQWASLPQPPNEASDHLITRLAQLHYELLLDSGRWAAAAIDWSAESRKILTRVASLADPSEL